MSDRNDLAAQLLADEDLGAGDSGWSELRRLHAERGKGVNPFEVLGLQTSEIHHSRVLKWLLDPGAAHGFGTAFLEGFLRRTILEAVRRGIDGVDESIVSRNDWSETEVRLEWQRIDVLVVNRKARFVCAIENKIGAEEGFGPTGVSQLRGYRRVLDQQFRTYDKHRVFLTRGGDDSGDEEERNHWVPERHATVLELLRAAKESRQGDADPDAASFLQSYEAILRRHVLRERDELSRAAERVYLADRELLEFIYRNRPDYEAGLRGIVKELIEEQPGWYVLGEVGDYVWFGVRGWDDYKAQTTGLRLGELSNALVFFGFYFWGEPVNVWGPGLVMGIGTDQNMREAILEFAVERTDVFDPSAETYAEHHMHLFEYERDLLGGWDYGPGWADGSVRDKLREHVERFARERFPALDEAMREILGRFGTQSA